MCLYQKIMGLSKQEEPKARHILVEFLLTIFQLNGSLNHRRKVNESTMRTRKHCLGGGFEFTARLNGQHAQPVHSEADAYWQRKRCKRGGG